MKYLFYQKSRGALLALVFISTLGLFGYAQGTATAVSAEKQITEFDVNGLKVLIKRRPGTPTVAAGLFIRGGSRNITAENAGIENFMLNTAAEGSKNFPRQALRKEISKTGSTLGAGSNSDFSVFSIVTTKQNFANSWQIFTDVAMNPAFAQEDIDRIRQRLLLGLRTRTDSPESLLESELDRIMYAGHPYANDPIGTAETILKFKAADLAAYHKKMMETTRLVLVVVGDVEPEALRKQVAESFGKLPRGNYKETPMPALAFTAPTVDVVSRPLQTDYVKGVFTAPNIGNPDYYAMRVAMALLQSRVFQEVRVVRNLSYAPDAGIDSQASNTGSISVSSTNPNESIKAMLGEINKLKQEKFDADMIKAMGGFFLTTYYLKQETNAAQVTELASYELNGGGWRNSLNFLDKMRQVTPDDMNRVVNKYLTNIRFVVVGNPADIDKQIFLKQSGE